MIDRPTLRHSQPTTSAASAALVVAVLCGSLLSACSAQPAPPAAGPSSVAVPEDLPALVPPAPSATASASLIVPAPTVTQVDTSRPLEIYWPALASQPELARLARIGVSPAPCPVNNKGYIDPLWEDRMRACVVSGPHTAWQLPSSSSTGMTLIAGHTYRKGDAAFNGLYDWVRQRFTVSAGDEMWIRTSASGGAWLLYRAVEMVTVGKHGGPGSLQELSQDWDRHPRAGRVFTVGCRQRAEGGSSVENVVITWDYDGVRNELPQ